MPILELHSIHKSFRRGFWGVRTPVLKGVDLAIEVLGEAPESEVETSVGATDEKPEVSLGGLDADGFAVREVVAERIQKV